MSFARHLLRGAGLNLMDLVIKTAAVFVLTPVLLKSLGTDGYGTWLLGMSFVGYLLLADMGMSFSVTRFLAMVLGAKDRQKETAVLATTTVFYRRAGVVVAVLSVLAVFVIPYAGWSGETARNLQWAVGVCGLTTSFRLALRLSMVLLRAHVRYDLIAWASLARTCVQTPAMYVAVLKGYGVPGVALCYAVGDCLEFCLQQIFSRKLPKPPEESVLPEEATKVRRELFVNARAIVLTIVGENLRLGINPFIINRLHGLEQVSVYSIGLRLITLLEDLVNALFGGQLLAAFSQLHGSSDKGQLVRSFERVSCITSGFSFCAMLGATWAAPFFLQRWLGPGMEGAYQVMLILSLPYALRFSHYPAHNLLYALGKAEWMVAMVVGGGAVTLGLGIFAGIHWGLQGLIGAVAVVMMVERLLVIPSLLRAGAGIPLSSYLGRCLFFPALKAMLFPAVYMALTHRYLEADYLRLLLLGSGFGAVFVCSFPWMVLTREERARIAGQLLGRFRRSKA